ncbi:MAG: putative aminohydrolase SsnA [Armatimonadetes bacterium]|nr:putative aminohydrolase SsnA [Armatimonadota bacterium]
MESPQFLIVDGTLVTLGSANQVIHDAFVAVESGKIRAFGDSRAVPADCREWPTLSAKGKVILPGFINAHTHLYSTFARGMSVHDPMTSFGEILERLWWRLDQTLTTDDIHYSALIALADCLRKGITTLFDHHSSPRCPRSSLDSIAEAFRKMSLRGCLCFEVTDRHGPEAALHGIEENRRFLEALNSKGGQEDLLTGMMGLHASFTLGPETLSLAIEAARQYAVGVHIHVAEGPEDVRDCEEKYGKTVVERLLHAGALGPRSILAHCVNISPSDIGILSDTGASVVLNPQSNMNNAVGRAPAHELLSRGVKVGLGSDGFNSGLARELQTLSLVTKHSLGDPRGISFDRLYQIAFANNAAIARRFFRHSVGEIAEGAPADLIFINYDPPTPLSTSNFMGHFLFGMAEGQVDTVFVGGKKLLQGGKLLHIDEEAMTRKSRELAGRLWDRF